MIFKTRKLSVVLFACVCLCGLSAQADAESAPPDVTDGMRWTVYFYDAGLGLRSAEATVDWAVGKATLRMTDEGGRTFEASRVISPGANGGVAKIIFPLGGGTTASRPAAAVNLGAADGQDIKTIAGSTDETKRVQAPTPPGQAELVVELSPDEEGDLFGQWSYNADPVTLSPSEAAGRLGEVTIDPDTLKTRVSGREIWLRRSPVIHYVAVVEDQVSVDRSGAATFPFGARAPLREIGAGRPQRRPPPNPAERTIMLVGQYFPPEESAYAPKPTIVGNDAYIFQRLSSKPDGDSAEDVKAGWQKLTAGMDPASVAAVKKMEVALFRVTLPREQHVTTNDAGRRVVVVSPASNALPGLQPIDWQGGQSKWLLQFGDNLASLRFVRPHRIGMDTTWEPVDLAFLPEDIAVELRTTLALPNQTFTVLLAIGEDNPPARTAERIGGADSLVWRTKVFTLAKPGAGQGTLGIDPGGVLSAAIEPTEMMFAGGALTNVAVFNDPSEVPQGNSTAPTWTQYLVRSARANGIEVPASNLRDLAPKPAKVFSDFFLFSPQGKFYLGKVSPEQVKNEFSTGDHAAMLLLRDAFAAELEGRIARLDEVKLDPRLVEGFGHDARSTILGSPAHPLGKLPAGDLNGKSVTLLDALDSWSVRSAFKGDEVAADTWRLGALRKAIDAHQTAMRESLAKARAIGDDAVEDLLAMTARGFEPVAARLQQRLMRFDESQQRWVIDDVARGFIAGLSAKYEALIGVKEAKAKQTTLLVQVVATVTGMRALSGIKGFVGPLIAAACNGVPWAMDSFRQFSDLYDSKAEVRFAFGASAALGDDRYQAALAAEGSFWKTMAIVTLQGVAAMGPDSLAVLRTYQAEMAVLRGRVLFEELGSGVVEFGNLTSTQRRDMLAFAQDARATLLAGKQVTASQAVAEAMWYRYEGVMSGYAGRPTAEILAKAAQPMRVIAEARQVAAAGRAAEREVVQLAEPLRQSLRGASRDAAKGIKEQIKSLETRRRLLREALERLESEPASKAVLNESELAWLSGRRLEPDNAIVDDILSRYKERWLDIKKAFEIEKTISPAHMHQFVTARKQRVDKTLREAMDAVEKKTGGKLEFSAFGSTNLTSDYDISVRGEGAELVVAEFNKRFRAAHHDLESGTVFDTNIYTDPVYKIFGRRDLTGKTLALNNQDLDMLRQFVYDQMASRKYLHGAEEWAAHKGNLFGGADADTRKLLEHVFEEAETANEAAIQAIQLKLPAGKTIESLGEGAPELLSAQNRANEEVLQNIHDWRIERQRLDRILTGEAENFPENAALLDKYPGWAKSLREARELATKKDTAALTKLGDEWRDRMAYQLRKKQGEALYFASEAYQTEGSILHVVDEIQAGGNKITVRKLLGQPRASQVVPAGSLNSLLENRANMLKELAHVRQNGVFTNASKAAAKGAKYFIRILDAAHQAGIPLAGIAPRDLLELTVGIDAARGSIDDVAAFLAKNGTAGEVFVARLMKASDQLAQQVVRQPEIRSLAQHLRPLIDEVGTASEAARRAVDSPIPLPVVR